MNNKLVYITIVSLLVLAGLFAYLNRNLQQGAVETESITVVAAGEAAGELTMEQVKQLPTVRRNVTIRSSSEGVGTHSYTGAPLRAVLEAASPGLTLADKKVTVKGFDSFTVVLTGAEIVSNDNVLLVYAQDDQPLGSKARGGTGPFRLIILGDQFGLRAVKYVNELEVH